MKTLKPCFFYLLNFVAVGCFGFITTCFAQQSCRIYTNNENSVTPGTSSVANSNNTIGNSDTTDYSTINVPLNLVGITTAYQNLVFSTPAPANTPVVLKIGGVSSALAVSGQITIQAYSGGTPVNPAIPGSAINSSGNTWVRFIPQGSYNSIRISLSSAVGLGSSINIFYAYQDISPLSSFSVNQLIQCLDNNNFNFTNTSTVNSGTLTHLWKFGDGITSTLTSPSHTYANPGIYTVTLTATAANGCTGSFKQIVTVIGGVFTGNHVGLPFHWVGAPGADWGTPSNWRVLSSGYYYIPSLIPTASNIVSIGLPATAGCPQAVQQQISIAEGTIAQCAELNIASNAIVQLNGSLIITGNLNDASSGANGIRGSQTGKLTITGNGTPTSLRLAAGYEQLASLDITRTNGASAAVTLTSPLAVFNYVNLGGNNILDSQSGNLTLKSSKSATASVYNLPAGAVIKGAVNAERFFYAGGNPTGMAAYRSYRLISSPVSNITYNYNGTQSAPVYNLNYIKAGAIITGPANGNFDKTGNPTLYLFREDINVGNTSFTSGNFKGITSINPATNSIGTQSRYNLNNVTDTTIQLAAGNGVLFFFRGDRGNLSGKTTAPFTLPQDVTFTNTGVLNQGDIPVKIWFKPIGNLSYTSSPSVSNTGVMGYNLVGNPYACTIDWNTNSSKNTTNPGIVFNAADVDTKMYVFDPLSKTYNWFDSGIGANGGNDGNPNVTQYIASGQGFFIRAKNSTATLTFREAAKVNNETVQSSPVLLGLPKPSADDLSAVKIQLKMDSVNYDYAAIYFNKNWKSVHDLDEDASDLDGNGNTVNLSTFSADQKRLAINKMPALQNQTVKIQLYVKGNSSKYELIFPEISNIPAPYTVFLKDNFTKDSTQINSNSSYSFQMDQSDTNSWGDKRFELIFHLPNTIDYRLLSFRGNQNQKGFVLNWITKNEGNYTSFTIEKSVDNGKTYTSIGNIQSDFSGKYTFSDTNPVAGKNIFRLKQDDLYNRITYSDLVSLMWSLPAADGKTFAVYPNPAVNQLNINLLKEQKGLIRSRIISMQGNVIITGSHQATKWSQTIQTLSPGVYAIVLQNEASGAIIGQTKFIKK